MLKNFLLGIGWFIQGLIVFYLKCGIVITALALTLVLAYFYRVILVHH